MSIYPAPSARALERWSQMLGLATELLNVRASRILRRGEAGEFEVLIQRDSRRDRLTPRRDPFPQRTYRPLCESVASERAGVYIVDSSTDPRWRDGLLACRLISYLGLPIAWPDEATFGIIEVLDGEPRMFSGTQRKLIEQLRACIEDLLARIVADEQRQRLSNSLATERDRLRLASAANGSGVWDYNIDADVLYCDQRWHDIVGLDRDNSVKSIEDFKPHIHPDDVERATEVHATMAELIAKRQNYRINFRIVRPDGEIRWLQSAACLVPGSTDSPNRAVGAVVDITDQTLHAAALAESELRFKTLAEMLPQNIFTAQPDGTIDYHNKRMSELVGASSVANEPTRWPTLLHPDDFQRTTQAWEHSLATGQRYDVETRCHHHSGEYRWLRVTAVPLLDDAGKVIRWFGAATDIHAAKLLEMQREMLARELDHRIRNLFTLVQSLVSLSVRENSDMAPFANELQLRLAALHKAHNLALRCESADTATCLQDLIRAVLEPYGSDTDQRIAIGGDDTQIDAGTTPTLALIFHELATNAAKYGALRIPRGQLHITLTCDNDWLRIDWAERVAGDWTGGSERKGFGSTLMNALVEGLLQGKLSTHQTAQGLVTGLQIPLYMLRSSEHRS